jgi:CubicO group peptidase (beta-lactamase class C family)
VPKLARTIASTLDYVPGYLEFQQRYQPFVGAQVAVRVDGELLLNHAVGLADVGGAVPLTSDHLFRIASHSKTFTAVACMQLVERGKLRLDDRARDHVPALGKSPMGDASVRELLGHGSGMIRDGVDSTFWSLDRTFPDRKELLKVIKSDGKVLEPNEHFKYSNIGYSLLGLIVEGASGQPYRVYVSEHIVGKLGLKDTGPDLDFDRIDDYAKGYTSRAHGHDRREIEHLDTFEESAATGFFSTAAELTDYFQAHLDGDDRLLSDGSKRRMRQAQWNITDDSSYGLGLSISEINGRTYYGHGGGYPGHITISHLDLERRLSLSVFTNMNDGPAGSLATAILNLIDLALTEKAKTEPGKAKELARFEGRFATLWGVIDVANIGGRLYMLAPTLPNPAAEAVELEIVSGDELTVVGDKGFGGFGEPMKYTFRKNGSVKQIRGASGAKLVPIEDFTLPERITRPA